MNYGSDKLKKEIIPEVLAGRKFISLAISEAFAGSDVAGLRCTATKTADGKHFIVNGTKKWITNGVSEAKGFFAVPCGSADFNPLFSLSTSSVTYCSPDGVDAL